MKVSIVKLFRHNAGVLTIFFQISALANGALNESPQYET
jgi:hypothetical protein